MCLETKEFHKAKHTVKNLPPTPWALLLPVGFQGKGDLAGDKMSTY